MYYVNVEHQMYRDFDTIIYPAKRQNLVYVYIQVCMSKLSLFIIERFQALLTSYGLVAFALPIRSTSNVLWIFESLN